MEFNQGIMGIVGPNGSGKSNVADAVRWVLGEQSAKQLRGANMQDVIFAGTENRKPQGYASVSLVIDNSDHLLPVDYEEVTVARRVYRSGESEYLLNGQQCRLRDVNELFYDTGVGKEGYSIIGQGQIDRILSNKPEDRRELFDEAAGIVKFKKRKLITQKKLDTEEGNLVRVTDILKELEKQVGPLEKQAEKARAFLKYKEELKKADMQAFSLETGEYSRRLSDAEQNKKIVDDDLEQARAEAEAMKARYDALSEELSELEEALSSANTAVSEKKVHLENLEGQVRMLQEQLKAALMNEETVRARLKQLETESEERDEEYRKIRADKQKLMLEQGARETDLESLESDLAGIQDEIRRQETRLAQLHQKHLEAMEQKTGLTASLERSETLWEQTGSRLAALETAASDSASEKKEVERLIREGKAHLESLAQEEKNQKGILREARVREEDAEKKLRNVSGRLAQAQQNYHTRRSQRESLLNLAERYEGYGSSIRRVMERKSAEPGILGVVADLFHTQAEYETAIETALGGRIQNIVTRDETTAKRLVEYLKSNRYGRATFLPLTSVRGKDSFPRPEALRETGALGVASELVETQDEFLGIARYLLGRYLVVDTIDHALAIASKYRYSLNLVTLEGELLSPGGAITGGSYKNNSNLLGRRREIEELGETCKALQKQIKELREQQEALEQAIAEAVRTREEAQGQLHRLELARNTASIDLNQQQSHRQELAKSAGELQEQEKELRRHFAAYEKERGDASGRISELDRLVIKCEGEAEETSARLEELKKEQEETAAKAAEMRQEVAALAQRADFLSENQERVIRERDQRRDESLILSESLEGGEQMREQKESQQKALEEEIIKERENCRILTEDQQEKSARKDAVSRSQQQIFGDREVVTERMSKLDRESLRLQNSIERLNDQIHKLVEYIWNEYEMTPSEAEAAADPENTATLSESRKAVSALKTKIRELGPVNVNAMEEYRDVSERYTFLSAQHADLVKASDSLKKIIRELEAGMRKQFKENFARIQTEFEKVFKELFGGGKGQLSLTEAEDILEAGIIINAQPPGKKLQNMMQLSGGEKALTAIALLFAIQNLKPSPFCLLDEIEAALDEPNVDRYAAYLNRLKGHTQFIVITHRRGTMEMADRLYGITMQEKGVSALVSVDLTDPSIVDEAG
ncbi:MAG: chromosome segregation protein SMC [Lachnospiraceae bacterium]|nr:chromosome segregation protein SMC [Lachnospiraceae bacterium]